MARPAGNAESAPAVRKIAGPSPSRLSKPVTSTNVSEATAATSWRTHELIAVTAARRNVLRPTGRSGETDKAFPEVRLSAVRRVPHVGAGDDGMRKATDGDDASPLCELGDEGLAGSGLGASRPAVRARLVRPMRMR